MQRRSKYNVGTVKRDFRPACALYQKEIPEFLFAWVYTPTQKGRLCQRDACRLFISPVQFPQSGLPLRVQTFRTKRWAKRTRFRPFTVLWFRLCSGRRCQPLGTAFPKLEQGISSGVRGGGASDFRIGIKRLPWPYHRVAL